VKSNPGIEFELVMLNSKILKIKKEVNCSANSDLVLENGKSFYKQR